MGIRRRAGRSRVLLGAGLVALIAIGASACTPVKEPAKGRPGTWLATVNYYRSLAGLAGVTENPAFSYGNYLHGRYMVKNNVLQHFETPGNPWYTPEGDAAAQSSNLAFGLNGWTERDFIEGWLGGPFHALGLLSPGLSTSGFGAYSDGSQYIGGGVDVARGSSGGVPAQPVLFPGDGAGVPLTHLAAEYPDPLTSCGFVRPAGQPIILQLPEAPVGVSAGLARNGVAVGFCMFTGDTYANPDGTAQSLGRNILAGHNAVILIPQEPLIVGASYGVGVSTSARSVSWTFHVVAPPGNIG